MNRLILAAAGMLALGSGSAVAASCPAFPPPVIKFVPLPSDVARDTSKTAKELGATTASPGPQPVRYEHDLDASVARAVAIQKLPDGTICAGLQEVDIKLGFKRKIDIAKEFADNSCVANTIADYEAPAVKADDEALAAFGATIPQTYGADVNAIGTNAGKDQDDAQKPLLLKVSALLKDKIYPAFEKQVGDSAAKVDLSKWQKAPCDGATDKAMAAAGLASGGSQTSSRKSNSGEGPGRISH
jgi:hypothetical protein